MQQRVAAIRAGAASELVWLVEHPPLYTAGTSARPEQLTDPTRFPTFATGRGGQWTYHGPGQRVAYVMLDLTCQHGAVPARDVRCFVHGLEEWLIRALARFNVSGERREGRIGIWVADHAARTEAKIAAIGVRVSRWVSWHGIALNVAPDLGHYAGIVPCGISEHGVTSLHALRHPRHNGRGRRAPCAQPGPRCSAMQSPPEAVQRHHRKAGEGAARTQS